MRHKVLRALLCGALLLSITACGFALRSERQLPPGMEQVQVISLSAKSPLYRALVDRLKVYQIASVKQVERADQAATIRIELLPDTLERRLLSLFSTGQVAEYELVLSVRYQVAFPGQDVQFVEFDVTREYQDDPDAILAKSRELELVLSEMRAQAADRIIRLLTSQSGVSG